MFVFPCAEVCGLAITAELDGTDELGEVDKSKEVEILDELEELDQMMLDQLIVEVITDELSLHPGPLFVFIHVDPTGQQPCSGSSAH